MKRFAGNVTLQQLQALVFVAGEGSFSRAAKVMCLTQPSITKHIQKLEEIVGAPLMERGGDGVRLTAEGKVVFEYAGKIFLKLDEMEERVGLVRDSDSGTILLAASTIPATYLLPGVLSSFRKTCPDIRCFVKMNDSDVVRHMVLDGDAEIGFMGSPPGHKKLYGEALWDDRLVLIIPAGHKWIGRKVVAWEEIAREPFVSREVGSATRETIERFLSERNGPAFSAFNVAAEMGSSESVKEAVAAGLGVSVLSWYAARRACEEKSIFCTEIEGPPVRRAFYMIYRKQFSFQRHHRLFLDFIRRRTSSPEQSSA